MCSCKIKGSIFLSMFLPAETVKTRCWNTVRDCALHHVVTIRLLSLYMTKLPNCSPRTDDLRPSPEEGDQTAGAGAPPVAGPGGQHHRHVEAQLDVVCSYASRG